jgi:hypothetical protein
MSPFIIIGGNINEPNEEMAIAGGNEVLLQAYGILEGFECLMCMYYISNVQYPKECANTYTFLQRSILKVFDNQKVPTKVLILMSELSRI